MSQKIYKNKNQHIDSIGNNIMNLIAPGGGQDYSDWALIGQRGALANKYLSETEGQALKNKLTGHKLSAIEKAMLDPKFKDLGIFGYSSLANPANAETLMKAGTVADLRPELVNQAELETLAHKMALHLPINESQDPGLELMHRDAVKQASLTGDTDHSELLKEVGAEIEQGDPGAVFATPEQSKMALALLGGRQHLTDRARAESITKQIPGKVNLLEKQSGVQEAEIGVKGAEKTQIETLTPLQAALLRGKTSVHLANVEKIIHGMALDEAESMQTQQKLIEEGKLAEARKNKVNVEMNSNKKMAAQKLLELKASTALEWAGVEKVISDIANNDMISALKSLKIVEETNTEKLKGDVEKQQIKRIKELINNLKAHGKQSEEESNARVDKTKNQTTQIQVETFDDSNLTQAKTNLTNLKGEGELAKIDLTKAKTEGELTDTMLNKSGGKKGKSQFDYRKTKTATEMQYNIEDVGHKFVVNDGWFDDDVTYLWPDDYKAISSILVPALGADKAAKTTAMAEAQKELIKMGKTNPYERKAIIKSIMVGSK